MIHVLSRELIQIFKILLYDAKHFNPYLALDNQMNMRATEMIHLNINALEEGMYKIKHFTLDKENGALFNLWRKHHTIHGMDKDSIDYVNRMSFSKIRSVRYRYDGYAGIKY
ncbi:AraC family transcriptional regulator [Staphylococcus aureus]|uniref:AraC family transcriptional regulator n=1 Tax=Staphylococcus aureus TaxID=1280 RepID=A0A380DHD5_STAAU|nr:AraC family transcriptional regulator [Staphylococcus aureus]